MVKKLPNQLKYLQVSVYALNEYYATSSSQRYRVYATHHLLDLVKKNSASIQNNGIFWLQREGAAEFCKISVEGLKLTESGLEDTVHFRMCKNNFLEIFTELADTSIEKGSDLFSDVSTSD